MSGPVFPTGLILLGLVEVAALATLGWWPAAHRFPLPGLLVFGVAFAAYLVAALHVAARRERGGTPERGDTRERVAAPGSGEERARAARVRTIWLFAVALRLALLPLAPELSDDVHRYLWDGHVQLSGTNPYVHAPAAPELEALRTSYHHRINNPSVPTIYPPLAQLAFLLVALAGSSLLVTKLLWLACDLGTAWVLARVARETGRDDLLVLLLYAWAPLLVVEVAWSAHLEPLGLLFLALAILGAHRARKGSTARGARSSVGTGARWGAGAALGLSALTKLAPAAALPALARRWGWRPLAAFCAVVAISYLPYLSAGGALFTGLRTYGEHWWFMKGAFGLLEVVAGSPGAARLLAGLVVAGVVAWTAYRRFDLERALLWTLGAGMIVTPTFHPWYVLWMLPMAALRASRPWIVLSGLAFIGYFGLSGYQDTGTWAQPLPARAALWVPFFLLLAADARRMIREDTHPGSGHGSDGGRPGSGHDPVDGHGPGGGLGGPG